MGQGSSPINPEGEQFWGVKAIFLKGKEEEMFLGIKTFFYFLKLILSAGRGLGFMGEYENIFCGYGVGW